MNRLLFALALLVPISACATRGIPCDSRLTPINTVTRVQAQAQASRPMHADRQRTPAPRMVLP